MRDGFPGREWTEGGYGAAWERARQYFPGKTYYRRAGDLLHDPRLRRGRTAVHGDPRIGLSEALRREQADLHVRAPSSGPTAACRSRRTGARPPPSGRNWDGSSPFSATRKPIAASAERWAKTSTSDSSKSLREEDYHMLAGGFMHEGMHAGLDDALVARLQAEFSAGTRPVQWDELRAFMAEIGYHGPYDRWAAGDIAGHWRRVEGLLGELEGLRKKPRLGSGSGPGEVRTRPSRDLGPCRPRSASACGRSGNRPGACRTSPRASGRIMSGTPLRRRSESGWRGSSETTAGFVTAVGEAAQATELAVRSLEAVLDTWGEWAEGRRPFPPPVTDSQAAVKQAKGILWPGPPWTRRRPS